MAEEDGLIPYLSVLMPVRNASQWLGEAIESILAQSYRDFELIIVDDGSSDGSPGIIEAYSSKDERIVATFQPQIGLVAALNLGLGKARAALVARLDADDIAEPSRFARQVAVMNERREISVLATWAHAIDARGKLTASICPDPDPRVFMSILARGNPVIHSSVMFRTSIAVELRGYRAAFAAAEDYDLWLRMSERGTIAILPCKLIRYRVHSDSISSRKVLLQLFSTRLAQRSAAIRMSCASDPANDLSGPPDLWSQAPAAYGDEFRLFRFLAWADPESIPGAHRGQIPEIGDLSRFKLNRKERKIAQQAIIRGLEYHSQSWTWSTWWRLVTLYPLRSIPIIWRYLKKTNVKEGKHNAT